MAENKKSFLLYCDLIHTIEELTDDEAGKLFKHVLRYVNDRSPEPPDRITKIAFEPIKQALKRDLIKYEQKMEKFSSAGKESAKSKKLAITQLYILKFYDDDEEFLKIGITDNSINRRFSSDGKGGSKLGYKYDILYQYFPENGEVGVIELERLIEAEFKNKKYRPFKTFAGHTECYDYNIVNNVIQFVNSFNVVQHRSTSLNPVQHRSTYSTVNVNDSVSVNVNDSVNDNVIKEKGDKEKRKRFVPPSIEEVKEYILERNNGIDAQKWIDHYTSNGWMVGKNKMKDWKAAVRTWEKNDFGNSGTKNKSGFDIKDTRYVPDPEKFETF